MASDDLTGLPAAVAADADLIYLVQGGNSRKGTVGEARTLSGDAQHGARGGGTQHDDAVPAGDAGFMTGADKTKIDGVTAGAEPNDVDSVFGRTGAVVAAASDYDASEVDNDSGIAGATVKDALDELGTVPQEVSATSDTTTASPTDVALASMSITPGAGNYMIWFSTSVEHTVAGASAFLNLYVGGVLVPRTEREFRRGNQSQASGVVFQVYLTGVGGGEALEVRWRTTAATATAHERTLTIRKVQ